MTQESVPMGRRADTAAVDRAAAHPQSAPQKIPQGIPQSVPQGASGRASAPVPLNAGHPTATTVGWVAAALGYCLVAGRLTRLSIPAELATLLPGAALIWYALRPATPRLPAPAPFARHSTLAWSTLAAVAAVWELYAVLRGSTHTHPTLSILMGPLIDPPSARAVGYAAWLLAGVWVVRR